MEVQRMKKHMSKWVEYLTAIKDERSWFDKFERSCSWSENHLCSFLMKSYRIFFLEKLLGGHFICFFVGQPNVIAKRTFSCWKCKGGSRLQRNCSLMQRHNWEEYLLTSVWPSHTLCFTYFCRWTLASVTSYDGRVSWGFHKENKCFLFPVGGQISNEC